MNLCHEYLLDYYEVILGDFRYTCYIVTVVKFIQRYIAIFIVAI